MVLTRLRRDGNMVGLNIPWNDFILKNDAAANVSSEAKFVSPLILEEIAFTIEKQPQVNDIAERIKKLLCANSSFDPKRFVVIPNEDFQYMVTHATQIATRIKLNDQKTTTGGGGNMWVEETLPPETILYALALCHGSRMKGSNSDPREVVKILHEFQSDNYLQLGGNETVGQGWCCLNIYHGR
jgi:CRISPR-associated protein Cmr4